MNTVQSRVSKLLSIQPNEPTTSRGRETKARIVTAAAELMFKRGVAGTSVDDVLKAAGVGKSQFYHYFFAKTELVGAVLQYQLSAMLVYQDRFNLTTLDGIECWLNSLVAELAERGFCGGCPLGTIVAEVVDRDDRLQAVAVRAFTIWENKLVGGLQALKNAGGLRADADPKVLAQEALASVQGGYLLALATVKREARPMKSAIGAAIARLRPYAS